MIDACICLGWNVQFEMQPHTTKVVFYLVKFSNIKSLQLSQHLLICRCVSSSPWQTAIFRSALSWPNLKHLYTLYIYIFQIFFFLQSVLLQRGPTFHSPLKVTSRYENTFFLSCANDILIYLILNEYFAFPSFRAHSPYTFWGSIVREYGNEINLKKNTFRKTV